MANVHEVAKYFLSLSDESTPCAITPLKLQKLVYYAQGHHLGETDEPLFDEELLAWDHGPVVYELYTKYKKYGYFIIPREEAFANILDVFSERELETLDMVWNKYGHLDGKFLEELTHQEDPWLFTPKDDVINTDLIKDYFASQLVC